MTSDTATVTRDDGWWLASVDGLPGAHTEARTLSALDTAIREVVALAAGLPDEAMPDLDIDFDFHTGIPEIDDQATRVRRERHDLEELARRVAADTEYVIAWAVDNGYSIRDAAVLTGTSFQRVAQIAKKAS